MDTFNEDWKEFNDIKQELYFDPNPSYPFHKMASRACSDLNCLSWIMLSEQPALNPRFEPLYHDMDTFNEDWKEFNVIKQ